MANKKDTTHKFNLKDLKIVQREITYSDLLEAIKDVKNNQVTPLEVNDKTHEIVNGYHRFWAAVCLNHKDVKCKYVNADPTRTLQDTVFIYIDDNETTDKGIISNIEKFCKKRNLNIKVEKDIDFDMNFDQE